MEFFVVCAKESTTHVAVVVTKKMANKLKNVVNLVVFVDAVGVIRNKSPNKNSLTIRN